MPKVFISTAPFAELNQYPIQLLESEGISYEANPLKRKLTESELTEMIGESEALIAGTEPITDRVLSNAKNLKIISRVGVGLDSVDLLAAERRRIQVSYTPDAPVNAVAELTIGLIFSTLRFISTSNLKMHRGEWHRHFGRRLSQVSVGIVGVGRIGSEVIKLLTSLNVRRILANDIYQDKRRTRQENLVWVDKETLFREADVISIHCPLTSETKNMICKDQLVTMKKGAVLINTARGGIINETDLTCMLRSRHLSGAAIDVFEKEPYQGELAGIEHCLLTSHMGSMSIDCRERMEEEATKEVIRFFNGVKLENSVPSTEYEIQRRGILRCVSAL